MVRLTQAASILGAIAVFAICASPAPAAKGVKKTQEHHILGKVVSVQTANANVKGNAKGKAAAHATLTIHVSHHKHKKGQNVAVAKGSTHTFQITMHTRVDAGKKGQGAGVAALRPGEHVTVFAHHHHADKVVIHQPPAKKKKVA
jgi:hypothetical protein